MGVRNVGSKTKLQKGLQIKLRELLNPENQFCSVVSMESSPQAYAKSFESQQDFWVCAPHLGMVQDSNLCGPERNFFFLP